MANNDENSQFTVAGGTKKCIFVTALDLAGETFGVTQCQ
jgi:hypothetical protein